MAFSNCTVNQKGYMFIFACFQQENHYSFLQKIRAETSHFLSNCRDFQLKMKFLSKKTTAAPCQNILDSSKNNTDFPLSKENKKFHRFAQKLFTVYRESGSFPELISFSSHRQSEGG